MKNRSDPQLLADYAQRRAEAAFAELVHRHIDVVYSTALRTVRDQALAQDVAQGVFIALAKNAEGLADRPVLSGWLHRTARNLAANAVRSEVRRQTREQEAASMNDLLSTSTETSWEEIAPHLDAALIDLSESDRDAVMLRFFETKSAKEMAGIIGVSPEAAQKRLSRALDRLKEILAQRGVTVSSGSLAVVLSAHAVQAAPAGLATAIVASVPLAAAVTATTSAIVTKAITMTTLQKTLITATVVALTGTGLYQARQVSRLNDHVRTLESRQVSLTEQSQRWQRERDEAQDQLAALRLERTASTAPSEELLRLRSLAGVARRAMAEAEQLRAQLAEQAEDATNNPVTSVMAKAMERQMDGRLSRMTEALALNDGQIEAVRDLLMRQARSMSAGMQQTLSGRYDMKALAKMSQETGNTEEQIKALLTPDQLTSYPSYEHAEAAHNASLVANGELLQMQTTLGLSEDQLDRAYAALYQVNFEQINDQTDRSSSALRTPGNPLTAGIDYMQQAVERKIGIMTPILTEAQLKSYREQQELQLKLVQEIMEKMQNTTSSGEE